QEPEIAQDRLGPVKLHRGTRLGRVFDLPGRVGHRRRRVQRSPDRTLVPLRRIAEHSLGLGFRRRTVVDHPPTITIDSCDGKKGYMMEIVMGCLAEWNRLSPTMPGDVACGCRSGSTWPKQLASESGASRRRILSLEGPDRVLRRLELGPGVGDLPFRREL